MNFERIQFTGSTPERAQNITQEAHATKEHRRIHGAEQIDDNFMSHIEQYIPTAVYAIQEVLDHMDIDIQIENELAAITFHTETDRETADGRAAYSFPEDVVVFITNQLLNEQREATMSTVIHELWHALAGSKAHATISPEGRPREIIGVGFSRDIGDTWEDDRVLIRNRLEGFNEGFIQALTNATMDLIERGSYQRSHRSYIYQTDIVSTIVNGISTFSGQNYTPKLTEYYLKKQLFFLKDIYRYYGDEGVHLVKLISDRIETDDERFMHELIEQYFEPNTSPEIRSQLFKEIILCEKRTVDARNQNASENETYFVEPFQRIRPN